jgi:hypothetical protein
LGITMKTLPLLLAAALFVLPGALQAKIVRTVEKNFAVQPGGNLRAVTFGGSIRIRTADTSEVRVVATETFPRASTEKEADDLLEDLKLTLEQSGNDVTVTAEYPNRPRSFSFGSWPPVQVSLEITVPRSYNLSLNTSGGGIAVESVKGNVRARTSGGSLTFERIDGELDGSTSGGSIRLVEGTALARLSTSGGSITVERAGGPTEVSTSGGSITIDSARALLSARTSGGSIRATLTERLRDDATLSTSGGSIRVTIVKDAAFELDASTSGGNVRADGFNLEVLKGGVGKSTLVAKANGGGPTLRLRTSGGSIRVTSE